MRKFEEVSDIARVIIYLPYLKEGLQFAEEKGYQDICIRGCIKQNKIIPEQKNTLDLQQISQSNFIKALSINLDSAHYELCDLNELSTMKNIEKLTLSDGAYRIDLKQFAQLKEVELHDSKDIINLDCLTRLTRAKIYSLKSGDLSIFSGMDHLQSLVLWDCTAESLSGLSSLNHIKMLHFVRLNKLTSLNGLGSLHNLEEFNISYCRKVSDFSALKALKSLSILRVRKCKLLTELNQCAPNNSIRFLFVDELDSLAGVHLFSNLETIAFEEVTDGNISRLTESRSLRSASFINKKKYDFNERQMKQLLNNDRKRTKQ